MKEKYVFLFITSIVNVVVALGLIVLVSVLAYKSIISPIAFVLSDIALTILSIVTSMIITFKLKESEYAF